MSQLNEAPTHHSFALLLLIGAVATIVLGFTGFTLQPLDHGIPETAQVLNNIYRTLLLFTLEAGAIDWPNQGGQDLTAAAVCLHIARFTAAAVSFGAILAFAKSMFWQQIDRLSARFWRSGHVVVIGVGSRGRRFVTNARAQGLTVVGVDLNDSPIIEDLRHRFTRLDVVIGDASEASTLQAASIARADTIVITGPDDGTNLALVHSVISAAVNQERGWPWRLFDRYVRHATGHPDGDTQQRLVAKRCRIFVDIDDAALRRELENRDAFGAPKERFEVRAFTLGTISAQALFADHRFFEDADLRAQTRMHLVFVGAAEPATSILVHFLRIAPFGTFERPVLSILVDNPVLYLKALRSAYPAIDDLAEIRGFKWIPGQFSITDDLLRDVESGRPQSDDIACPVTTVFVCLGNDLTGIRVALHLRTQTERCARWRAPIFVHQNENTGLARAEQQAAHVAHFEQVIEPFGYLSDICHLDLLHGNRDDLAKAFHEDYRAKPRVDQDGKPVPPGPADRPWEELAETYRASNRRAADHLPVKLASLGYRVLGAPLTLPAPPPALNEAAVHHLAALEHATWANDKRLAGWRYCPERDDARRFHPDLVPFAQLPPPTQARDVDQVRAAWRLIQPSATAATANPTVRREVRIGLIGHNLIGSGDAEMIAERLETLVVPILAAHRDDTLTILTPLAPGSDLVLTLKMIAILSSRDVSWRLVIVRAIPVRRVIAAYEVDWHQGGLPYYGCEHTINRGSAWDSAAQAIAGTIATLEKSHADWVVDLTPPGHRPDDWKNDDWIQQGFSRASAYLAARCDHLIAVCDPARAGGPGGTKETVAWFEDPETHAGVLAGFGERPRSPGPRHAITIIPRAQMPAGAAVGAAA